MLNDEVIHGYISDTLGGFTAGGKLEPIKKLMRPGGFISHRKSLTVPALSAFPINGTLELETGSFREHSRDDYCSIQLTHSLVCRRQKPRRWERFIDEITAHDPKRG